MKRMLSAILCLVLCLTLSPRVSAAEARDVTEEAALASGLEELGLFLGVGAAEDGSTDFALDRRPSRVEAVTMLVRALGKGTEAEAHAKTHPFTDVPEWADGYVSYAYEQGLTKGVSDTRFGAEDTASAETFLTLMLRALGYTEGSSGEFYYTSPWAAAAWCGILPPQVDRRTFLRADVVNVTCTALFARPKGSTAALHEKLAAEGAFSAEQFGKVFPNNPFDRYRRMDAAITQALEERGCVGAQDRPNEYGYVCHIILKTEEADGQLVIEALVCTTTAEVTADNTLGTHGGGGGLWLFKLDPETLELRENQSSLELDKEGITQDMAFSPEVVEEWSGTELSTGMVWLCAVQAQEQITSGEVRYRKPTYEEAIAEITADYHSYVETLRLESEQCTILLGYLSGTPHGSPVTLDLVYKEGSALGGGVTRSLPLPAEHPWGLTYQEPQTLELSGDGLTLRYTYHFEEAMVEGRGTPEERVIHEAGTYGYTVDLLTGEALLEIRPD